MKHDVPGWRPWGLRVTARRARCAPGYLLAYPVRHRPPVGPAPGPHPPPPPPPRPGPSAYTWTNSMPVSWQNAFQSAAWWPRFITS